MFVISTKDGSDVVGQIVGREPQVLNSVSCAFYDWRLTNLDEVVQCATLPIEQVFSSLFVTRDLLDSGAWKVVANKPVTFSPAKFPYEDLRVNGFIGAKVIGSAIVEEFINAFYGLLPWDDWKDPDYLDKLLISQEMKPKALVFKSKTE